MIIIIIIINGKKMTQILIILSSLHCLVISNDVSIS